MPKSQNAKQRKEKQPPRDRRPQVFKTAEPGLCLQADQDRQRAVRLRIQGHSFAAIADTLGCSTSHAYRLVTDGWDRINELTDDDRRTLRAQTSARLDVATVIVMDILQAENLIVVSQDREGHEIQEDAAMLRLKSIDRLVKTEKLRADLFGIRLIPPKDGTSPGAGGEPEFEPLEKLVERVKAAKAAVQSAPQNSVS